MSVVVDSRGGEGIRTGVVCEFRFFWRGRHRPCKGSRRHGVVAWLPLSKLIIGEGLTSVSVDDSEKFIIGGAQHADEASKLGVFTAECIA